MRRCCVIATLVFGGLLHAAPTRAASITFESLDVVPGQSFEIRIFGSQLLDVFAFSFAPTFDIEVLKFTRATEGSFLSKAGETSFVFCPDVECPSDPPGVLASVAGSDAGVNSAKPFEPELLATLFFTAVDVGDTEFQLNARLLDSKFKDIAFELKPGTITTVPEPSTLGLLAVGLVALTRRARRRAPPQNPNTL